MRSIVFYGCAALCSSALAAASLDRQAPPRPSSPAASTAIVGARLIDGAGTAPTDDSVVVVEGDRIRAAGPRARVLTRSEDPDYGSIRIGKAADLLLLNADPTVDINNTIKISKVMSAGRWVPER
jgi:hypothetical protein